MEKSDFAKILKITSPIFFGYVSIGIPFGLMVAQAGYPWWLAPLMSVTMYTGTGQYIAIGMFAARAGLAQIMLVQVLVGIRHIFYGLSLLTKFKVYLEFSFRTKSETGCRRRGVLTEVCTETALRLRMLSAAEPC